MQRTFNVTSRRDYVTFVTVKKQYVYGCVFLALVIEHAKCTHRIILFYSLSGSTVFFNIIS